MKKYLLIALITLFLSSLTIAQPPKKIHDLKSLTDSSGTVHLFYRIYAEYSNTEYSTNNIYHYNTQTGQDTLFMENYYDTRLGFPYSVYTSDYKFLDNDPQNYVFITRYCDNECLETISRPDSADMMGGLFVTMDHLNVEGPDSGRVYVEMDGEVIIGFNGGREFPKIDAENFEEMPDSLKLGFPLISVSPYNDSLMFGRKSFHSDGESAFLRSLDKGKTSEFLSDTLLPANISYDSDSNTVYIIDTIGAPSSDRNCSIDPCRYGLYTSNTQGGINSWQIREAFNQRISLVSHPTQPGKLYIWNADSVLITEDFGETFEVLLNPNEEITGFSVSPTKEYYTTTSALYSHENGGSVELLSIPVSNEAEMEFPNQFELLQNYPNPFNPVTTITYKMRTAGVVTMELYTIQGQRVKKLVNDFKTEGQHSFRLNGSDLASGIYILRGQLGVQTETRKITLIK